MQGLGADSLRGESRHVHHLCFEQIRLYEQRIGPLFVNDQPQRSPNRRGIVSDSSGHKAVNSITGVATKIMSFSAGQTVS